MGKEAEFKFNPKLKLQKHQGLQLRLEHQEQLVESHILRTNVEEALHTIPAGTTKVKQKTMHKISVLGQFLLVGLPFHKTQQTFDFLGIAIDGLLIRGSADPVTEIPNLGLQTLQVGQLVVWIRTESLQGRDQDVRMHHSVWPSGFNPLSRSRQHKQILGVPDPSSKTWDTLPHIAKPTAIHGPGSDRGTSFNPIYTESAVLSN